MKGETTPAFDMLRSIDFFTELRTAMQGVGLAGEESFGVGVYFVAASRFFQNPLRLCVQEQTEGGANYVVRRVAKLLQPESFVELPSDPIEAWRGFAKKPAQKVVYLPDGDGAWHKENSKRFEIAQNQISRVVPVKRGGRVVEEREDVEAAFACISTDHRDWMRDSSRWLTTLLDKPPQQTGQKANSFFRHASPLNDEQTEQWHRLQDLIQARAQLGIVLPEWADLVVEETCKDERAARHLSAYLQAWKTMCLFRSLPLSEKEIAQRGGLKADFTDFAGAGSLVRKLFREGHWFPSRRNIFNKVTAAGEDVGFIHPISGKVVRFRHRSKPVRWAPVLAFEGD
jgi:hypothetical protein